MAGEVRLPDIKASVKVDTKGVDEGLDRVQRSTKGAGSHFDSLRSKATGAIDGMASSLTGKLGPASGAADSALAKLSTTGAMMGAGVAAGAALAGVAVAKLALDGAQAFVGLAGEVRNFQRASGASAEDSSRMVAVLDDMGISSEVGAKAIFKLSREIGEGGKNLAKYGVEIEKNKSGQSDMIGTILNLADAYTKTNDPGQRAAMVMNTLGKQGQALIPILEQGRAGVEAFFAGAENGRQIFSQADLDKARAYELAIDDLGDTFRGLKMEGGEALLPFLTNLAGAGTKTLEFVDTMKSKVPAAFDALGSVASATVGPIGNIVSLIGGLGGKSDSTKQSTKALAEEVKASALASQEDARVKQEQAAALDRVTNATIGTLSSQLSYERSVNTLKDNINDLDDRTEEYSAAVAKNGANSKEAETANRALRDAHHAIKESALNAAGAAVRLAEDTAAAGGETLSAQRKAEIFRAKLEELAGEADGPTRDAIGNLAADIDNIPNRTVTIDVDLGNAYAHIAALERRISTISSRGDSTSGPQQFAGGLDMGPVRGRPGQAVPIIAHAGEWVVTPAQLADLRNSPAPGVPVGTSGSAGVGIDYDRLAAAIAAHPPRAYVVASDVAKGLHDNRRR